MKYMTVKYTVKLVLSGNSKIDKTKVFKTNGSLMKVESISECSPAFYNSFDLHLAIIGLENQFWSSFLVAAKRQVLLVHFRDIDRCQIRFYVSMSSSTRHTLEHFVL